jgi:uncharacterized membrane protein YdjX (TVP38/TMEM64 family)
MTLDTESNTASGWKVWLLPAALIALLLAGGGWLWHSGILHHLADRQRLIASLRQSGPGGPLLCITAQFIQVVIFFVPGEITQFAAGYVFGTWRGLAFSVVGIMLGSAFDFYFARIVGRPALKQIIRQTTMERVDNLLNNARGKSAIFLLFLLPGAPKDAMCYGAGLSNMSPLEFIVISSLGRIPALLFSIHLGSQVSHGDFLSMALMIFLVVIAVAAYYLYERNESRRRHSKGED